MPHKYTPEEWIVKFWEKVAVAGEDDCWLWLGAKYDGAYGSLRWGDRHDSAHRISYLLAYGEFDRALNVLHKCDNPPCVNPKHLFLGTRTDNMRDKEAKGRGNQPRGATHHKAKLTTEQIQEIRTRYAAGNVSTTTLGREYNTHSSHISAIVRFKVRKDS